MAASIFNGAVDPRQRRDCTQGSRWLRTEVIRPSGVLRCPGGTAMACTWVVTWIRLESFWMTGPNGCTVDRLHCTFPIRRISQ
ncbi:hypothetical protein COCNU_15G000190 [Cocos nucifera]|uniref:Uncharacterized protein n=1 Tax=Cocos nucifera TaxID=13894 RepID=A0A8K0NDQ7_COCNU|nr:hypothetical protein COCNU_15G000190 [Cocos nucifera]